jgi:hypothetical protein
VPKHSTDVAALHAMCDLLIKNPINNPMLEEKLIKKSRSDLEGCSLLLALAGILANKYRLNTVRGPANVSLIFVLTPSAGNRRQRV